MDNVTFDVDHLVLERGLYLAREDVTDGVTTYTFDLRNRRPYREEVMSTRLMHTYEHAFATSLRNVDSRLKLIYFGPMGCQTGFYILVQTGSDGPAEDEIFAAMVDLLEKATQMADKMEEVPASAKIQCGNALSLGDTSDIKTVNKDIKDILNNLKIQGHFDKYTWI